ncbi:MAG: hypothetical protein EP336_10610 [Rhodobacteraceae bacterium]|nr:MAG: hypothetical protein EP336_10610 [Paracoccaceae bacterium]
MEHDQTERYLLAILGHFNVNVAMSDEVPKLVNSLPRESYENVKAEYARRLKHQLFGTDDFYDATACDARDKQSARQFFEDVYKYAFEGGEEPDVTDYWDRPKPTDW